MLRKTCQTNDIACQLSKLTERTKQKKSLVDELMADAKFKKYAYSFSVAFTAYLIHSLSPQIQQKENSGDRREETFVERSAQAHEAPQEE